MAENRQTEAAQAAGETTVEASEFEALLQKEFKPKTDRAREEVQAAVQTLAAQALADTALISDDAVNSIESIIAALDKKLSDQVNQILHHEDFQKLEGTWRGLAHLVNNTETDETLKVRVFNISQKDVAKTLKKYKGTSWDQSPLFKRIYEDEFGTPGGEPYGCLIGDYTFDHSPQSVEMLNGMAKIAAASHAPFIAAAGPELVQMDSWQELNNPRDLTKVVQATEYAAWNSMRESDDAKYLGLTMPRFLSRLPYGAKTEPVEEFDFEEDTEGSAHGRYCWSNSAYAMGVNINRSFKDYGWCSKIRGVESGGMVEGLPCHTFPTDDGDVDMKCPTEIAITDRREAELSTRLGLMPLSHWKNSDFSVFISAQSLNKPAQFDDADATANAELSARLPYLFATCRFGHYLKCMVRDWVGNYANATDLAGKLDRWIKQYVTTDPTASEAVKARHPLAAAEVIVTENPSNPGYYNAEFHLQPHYQLEGLTVSLRLVSKLPSAKSQG